MTFFTQNVEQEMPLLWLVIRISSHDSRGYLYINE